MNKFQLNLESGLRLVRELEETFRHQYECHFALMGSILHKGKSDKDIDIIVYPRAGKGLQNSIDIECLIHDIAKHYDAEFNSNEGSGSEFRHSVWTLFIGEIRVEIFYLVDPS